jgi:serine/threonine protein kinase
MIDPAGRGAAMSARDKSPGSARLPSTSPDSSTTENHDPSTVADPAGRPDVRLDATEPSGLADSETRQLLAHVRLDPTHLPRSIGRVGHYEVLSALGQGAMGVVVRAHDTQLCRSVAIKLMSPQLMSSASARERFFREARAAAGINHPNIVTIHAVSEQAGVPYLVMEYVGGRTLMDRIHSEAPLKPVDILRISAQVASGLAAAHQQGVIHRDIKPANILLEDSVERVKITDFGLARVILEQSDLTSQGGLVGTPAYMSPEQVNGERLDARSDLFSMGCVMYAMLSGYSPFRAENALASARRVTSEKHTSLSEISKDVPNFFVAMVDRLLEKDPKDRYQSAGALLDELTGHLARMNSGADSLADAPSKRTLVARRTRQLALAGVCGAAVLALLTGFFFPYSRRSEKLAPQPKTILAPASLGLLRVTKTGGNDDTSFTSLTAALKRASAGSTIRVEGSEVYDETESIIVPAGLAGIKLEATAGATVRAPRQRPVLTIEGAPRVQVSGFRFETASGQHAVEIRGACPGSVIEDCQFTCASDSPIAAVYLHAGASGTADDPIRLTRLKIKCGGVGVVLGGREGPDPVSYVQLAECLIQGPNRQYGIPLVLQYGVSHASVRHNTFTTGLGGISLSFDSPEHAVDVEISENSLGNFHYAFAFNESSPQQGIKVRNNLIIEADTLQGGAAGIDAYATWFEGNWWERSLSLEEAVAARIAKVTDPLALLARDPEDVNYLKPAEATAGMPGRYAAPRPSP